MEFLSLIRSQSTAVNTHCCFAEFELFADCTTWDYAPKYGMCINGVVNITFSKYTDCEVGAGGVPAPEPLINQACRMFISELFSF